MRCSPLVRIKRSGSGIPAVSSRALTAYVYKVRAPGGIDVNATLGRHLNVTEREIAFPGGIARQFVEGAHKVMPDGSRGAWIPNPHFSPG